MQRGQKKFWLCMGVLVAAFNTALPACLPASRAPAAAKGPTTRCYVLCNQKSPKGRMHRLAGGRCCARRVCCCVLNRRTWFECHPMLEVLPIIEHLIDNEASCI